jgi:hypothetical protein
MDEYIGTVTKISPSRNPEKEIVLLKDAKGNDSVMVLGAGKLRVGARIYGERVPAEKALEELAGVVE